MKKLYTLHHPDLDGPFEVEAVLSETGIRAWATMHVLKTFDHTIPTTEWVVESIDLT